MKRWIHAKEIKVEASWEFWNWYENLCPCAKEAVDKIALTLQLPDYLECSDDELDRLYCFYTTQKRMARRRFMPMCATTVLDSIESIEEVKKALAEYEPEQVDLVKHCIDALNKDINNNWELYEDDDVAKINLTAIKDDYMMRALDEELMSEEDFEDIFALLDLMEKYWDEM